MRLPESEHLDIQHFSRLFDNMSESYKLFWFQAIVEQVLNGKDKMSYDELLNHMVVSAWSKPKLAARINQEERLIYYFQIIQGLQSEICVQPEWVAYITQNQEIIKGWIQFNMIMYLQKRNPSVPGIANKLYPPQERKMERVKKYWKAIVTVSPIHDIYGNGI